MVLVVPADVLDESAASDCDLRAAISVCMNALKSAATFEDDAVVPVEDVAVVVPEVVVPSDEVEEVSVPLMEESAPKIAASKALPGGEPAEVDPEADSAVVVAPEAELVLWLAWEKMLDKADSGRDRLELATVVTLIDGS